MGRNISPERQTAYYAGMALTGLGFLLIIIGFITFASGGIRSVNSFGGGESTVFTGFFTFFAGMVCCGVGQFIQRTAARGLAGSGILLDPQQARQDVEPWSRMTGGIVKDAIDEAGILQNRQTPPAEDFETRLRKLHQLKVDGILSEAEYEAAKAKILAGGL